MFPVLFHVCSSARMRASESKKKKKIIKNRARAREIGVQEAKIKKNFKKNRKRLILSVISRLFL